MQEPAAHLLVARRKSVAGAADPDELLREHRKTRRREMGAGRLPSQRKLPPDVVVAMQGETDLLEIVEALPAPTRLPGRLHGREQQADEDADDRHHDEQFDECHGGPLTHLVLASKLTDSPSRPAPAARPHPNVPSLNRDR
jgi:hypothetical protein